MTAPQDFGQQVVDESALGWRIVHRDDMETLIERGYRPRERYCGFCGSENLVRWKPERGFSERTGRRLGHWETYCPNHSWRRPWHHSGGVLSGPPPGELPPPPPGRRCLAPDDMGGQP